ncbi:MAG: ribosome small subunit-dependent GTPase A [Rhodothermales bacterium]|nr:ribosome small subunit-dependent GTPase A [Rhodothermales bacterium]
MEAEPRNTSQGLESEIVEGIVVRSTGSWHDVRVDGTIIPARIPGKFRLANKAATNPLAVGDRVSMQLNRDNTGSISVIHPRRNRLSRRAAGRRIGIEHVLAANLDAAWVIQAVRRPMPNAGFVDRFLVMAEYNHLVAGIVLNKIDLMEPGDEESLATFSEIYTSIGYTVLRTSAVTGDGLDALRSELTGKTTVMTGPSGAGKSTLLNALSPGLQLVTGAVSDRTNKGKHTTTFPSLHPLPGGGYVVDTPGIREYGLYDIEPDDLCHYFPEFEPYLDDCHFPNCTHDHEPSCAVRDAADTEQIHPSRYLSYLKMLDSLDGEDTGR